MKLMVENETFEQNVKCIFECFSYRMGVVLTFEKGGIPHI